MSRNEKIADTLAKYRRPDEMIRHRDFCREIADDLDLGGAERERFLRNAGAFEQ